MKKKTNDLFNKMSKIEPAEPTYVFITWSNIFICFQNYYRKRSAQKESI